jgi:hypothetical protein
MDLKETKRKDGSILVFCDFKELLMDAFNVKSMEEVEKYQHNDKEYIIRCPLCKEEHTKHKLYIKSDLTVGHCFLCGRNYFNITDNIDISFKIPEFDMFGYKKEFDIVKLSDSIWSLDKFKYEFDDYSDIGVKYLKQRNIYLEDLYKVLGFKFFDNNIVIPFYYKGELIYYQIRFTGNGKIRYFLPNIKPKPAYFIERDDPDSKQRIMICEGVFDAIAILIQAPEYTPVAVLGSSISDYQLDMIRDYSGFVKEIRIWMDETSISKKIANKVKTVIDYCPISIIKSSGDDPEESMNKRIQKNLPVNGWIKSNVKNLG